MLLKATGRTIGLILIGVVLLTAPVYAPLAGRESGDVTKRGGRWSNDFIWNTNWAEQLDYQDKLRRDREAEEVEVRAATRTVRRREWCEVFGGASKWNG
jgi:hypothetical protein